MGKIYAVRQEVSGEYVLVTDGEVGYYEAPLAVRTKQGAKAFNDRRGHTDEEVAAAMYGSCFGWDKPIAKAENWKGMDAASTVYGD